MRSIRFAAAALIAAPALCSAPAQAKTAYQIWAQGRGYEVSSNARGTTYLDDLAELGLLPPPPPPRYAYRHRRGWTPDGWIAPED